MSSVCLAIRLTDAFPTQISAFRITFPSTNQRCLIFIAMAFQAYLALSFIVSATADWLQWRHEMRKEFGTYTKSDEAREHKVFNPTNAVKETMNDLQPWYSRAFRAEVRLIKLSRQIEKYMTKQIGLYRLLLNTYLHIFLHHLLLFWFPVLLFFISMGFLVSWIPTPK